MKLSCQLFGQNYTFHSVKEVMGKANEPKAGDRLAGVSANSPQERMAARVVLSNLTVKDVCEHPAVPYEEDEVTRIILDDLNQPIYKEMSNWTIGELREKILSADGESLKRMSRGLSSEVIAAVAKLMGNMDLVYAASKISVTAKCVTECGHRGTASSRLQPNHPIDDVEGITASVLEGLAYGAGDILIGLNPVDASVDSVKAILTRFDEIKRKYEIPTQICVLAHVTTQMAAIRAGAPCDLIFQSIAGSQKANAAFGIDAAMLQEAYDLGLTQGTAHGPNVMYFETGQGSELSSDGHFGADQLVMESRCYGFARRFKPFMVNTVVGFIGPEYLYDSNEVVRAGLEDHFMAKLHGLPMGCDCCYTNHMKANQNDIDNLAMLLGMAGCNYIIGVPQADDVMLNYQSTSYHDTAALREMMGYTAIKPFHEWMEKWGIWKDGHPGPNFGDASIFL